jgi:hypothetical protein
VIYEVVVDSAGTLRQFAADFEHHCEGAAPALFGSIRFNSGVSIEPRIAVASLQLLEGDVGFSEAGFRVFLTHPTTIPVSVNYATADGTAHAGTDYLAASGTLTFAPGVIEQTASVFVITNTTPQPDRVFSLGLTGASGVPIGADVASVLIVDDDSGKTLLYLASQPHDPIGRGVRQTFSSLDGSFTGRLGGAQADIRFSGRDNWEVIMAPPAGSPLIPGIYENALHFPGTPLPGVPSLDVSGRGLGCSTVNGRFVVQEVMADGTGNLQRFAADFVQHCEGSPALFGSIRLNSLVPPTQQAPVDGDFNGDHKTDILWRNQATGEDKIWFMDGTKLLNEFPLQSFMPDPNWNIVGTADFDGDGQTDILWRNAADGNNLVWVMNGIRLFREAPLPPVADTNWKIVAAGAFDGDAGPDIAWRNAATGENGVWLMDGTTVVGGAVLPGVADLNWNIVGVGDFNAMGKSDILWRNQATGDNVVWFMNDTTVTGGAVLAPVPDGNWRIAGVGDFNGDGRPDIVWRNAVTGENLVWFMNRFRRSGIAFLPTVTDPNWTIVGPR